jgi:phenylalanyl-tRNA synthetase beta chain
MKISLKWLSQYYKAGNAFDLLLSNSKKLRELLPLNGLEVSVEKIVGESLDDVIVAKIEQFSKHPEADRLNICQVFDGKETLQIICGAPNVRKGMKVALARVGTVLPGNFKIKKAKIRGVDSFGMLCSEKEMMLSEEGQGIMDLDESLKEGTPFLEAINVKNEIWDFELTPDRADCLSYVGVAREMKRFIGFDLKEVEADEIKPNSSGDVALVQIENQAPEACLLYGAQLFEGVKNIESPDWLLESLGSLGIRSHNSIVDLSNHCLMELGHPLHTFDADKISGSKIIIRYAKKGEKMKTLDGEERVLSSDDLVIADLEKPLALAGVMGSEESGVTEQTKRVVLESAYFHPDVVRSMVQRHKIHTDSSHRFERGVDPEGVFKAAGRMSHHLKNTVGMNKRGAFLVDRAKGADELFKIKEFNFDLRALPRVLGIEIEADQVKELLNSVNIQSEVKSANVLTVKIPLYRVDLLREIDLVEEIARVYGFDKIPSRYPPQREGVSGITDTLYDRIQNIRTSFRRWGLMEVMPFSFVSEVEKKYTPDHKFIKLANPLTKDWEYMRAGMSLGILRVVKNHIALNQPRVSSFEVGTCFEKISIDPKIEFDRQCVESMHACWTMYGERNELFWGEKSNTENSSYNFYDAKGVAENFIEQLSLWDNSWKGLKLVSYWSLQEKFTDQWDALKSEYSWVPFSLLHPGKTAFWGRPGKNSFEIKGFVGVLHPQEQRDLLNLPAGFQEEVLLGEFKVYKNLWSEELFTQVKNSQGAGKNKILPQSKFPSVHRDISLVFEDEHLNEDILKKIKKDAGKLLFNVQSIDLYPLDEGKSSRSFRLILGSHERTLEEGEITLCISSVLKGLEKTFKATLR